MKSNTILIIILTIVLASPATAFATVLTFVANLEFSGGTAPSGAPPWFTVTFDDNGGVGSVDFTLTATNLTGAENVLGLYLNLDPALYGTLPLAFSAPTKTGSFDTPSISMATGFTTSCWRSPPAEISARPLPKATSSSTRSAPPGWWPRASIS
jgi:hypothetical protein